jgi:hypothetical protein
VLRFFWGGWSSFELMDGTKLWPLVRAKTQRSQERKEDGEGDREAVVTLGISRGLCEGDRRVDGLVLRVDGRWDCVRFVRVRSSERELAIGQQ